MSEKIGIFEDVPILQKGSLTSQWIHSSELNNQQPTKLAQGRHAETGAGEHKWSVWIDPDSSPILYSLSQQDDWDVEEFVSKKCMGIFLHHPAFRWLVAGFIVVNSITIALQTDPVLEEVGLECPSGATLGYHSQHNLDSTFIFCYCYFLPPGFVFGAHLQVGHSTLSSVITFITEAWQISLILKFPFRQGPPNVLAGGHIVSLILCLVPES